MWWTKHTNNCKIDFIGFAILKSRLGMQAILKIILVGLLQNLLVQTVSTINTYYVFDQKIIFFQ